MMNLPSNEKVEVRLLEKLLDYNYLTNSYKIYWFSGMFKEIIRGNNKIPFKRIACRMICDAWYPVVQYHLSFGISDQLKDIVLMINNKYIFSSDIKEEQLLNFLMYSDDPEIESKIRELCKYVPYRLISPFYSDTLVGRKDGEKNRLITELSLSSQEALYQIHTQDNYIEVNEQWFMYIYENQNIIQGWLNYKLVHYLQKKNPNVPAIPFKLHPPYQRDLRTATKFWGEVIKHRKIND
ncbi:hypothetical protein [Alkalicella caledoniensis]|uniref:hypothetical protein n=1 Tax=Alkalicella caledoniensis TaxID=2731377 RepID=UPI001FEBADE1|nr:hypothetical protein [Alkalicella caledoniensis]